MLFITSNYLLYDIRLFKKDEMYKSFNSVLEGFKNQKSNSYRKLQF